MNQHVPIRFQSISSFVEDDKAERLNRIIGRILAGVVLVVVAALVITAELRLTPEQRMDFFEATYIYP
jgi:hypothetical protein